MLALLTVGVTHDATAQKKKKKKKKGKTEQTVNPNIKLLKTDTSTVCATYQGGGDAYFASDMLAKMWLRIQVDDMDGEYGAKQYWEKLYAKAPGFSSMVYTNGALIETRLAEQILEDAKGDEVQFDYANFDPTAKAKFDKHLDAAEALLNDGANCYPPGDDLTAMRGYIEELRNPKNIEGILELYTTALDKSGNKTDPYSLISIARFGEYAGYINKISSEEARELSDKALAVAKFNEGSQQYDFAAKQIEAIQEQYDTAYAQIEEQKKQQAEKQATASKASAYNEMVQAVKAGDMNTAKAKYTEYINSIDDMERKYGTAMYMAGQYYNKQNFPEARNIYLQAASFDASKGDPYYYIGMMYLSSGPQCGPGTGFDSQRVLWPAFDKLTLAKSKGLPADLAASVDKTIADYTQYLPNASQIAKQGLTVGQSYTVTCWINEATTVRTQ